MPGSPIQSFLQNVQAASPAALALRCAGKHRRIEKSPLAAATLLVRREPSQGVGGGRVAAFWVDAVSPTPGSAPILGDPEGKGGFALRSHAAQTRIKPMRFRRLLQLNGACVAPSKPTASLEFSSKVMRPRCLGSSVGAEHCAET